MYSTFCVMYHLKHVVFLFIPLLPLCSALNVFECPFSLWLCKSVSAEKFKCIEYICIELHLKFLNSVNALHLLIVISSEMHYH